MLSLSEIPILKRNNEQFVYQSIEEMSIAEMQKKLNTDSKREPISEDELLKM